MDTPAGAGDGGGGAKPSPIQDSGIWVWTKLLLSSFRSFCWIRAGLDAQIRQRSKNRAPVIWVPESLWAPRIPEFSAGGEGFAPIQRSKRNKFVRFRPGGQLARRPPRITLSTFGTWLEVLYESLFGENCASAQEIGEKCAHRRSTAGQNSRFSGFPRFGCS